jgi:signal transduction histidine kinase
MDLTLAQADGLEADRREQQHRPKVLIVDDHPSNLLALEAVLARLQVTIVRAHSGSDALEQAARHDFAVILLDLRMPGLDGVETARMIRARQPDRQPPVIILTSHLPELDEIRRAYANGVVDFLQKPYAPVVLVAKVSVFVELFTQREKLRRYEEATRKRFEQQLVAIVSHDLRNPLNVIRITAEVSLRRSELGESNRRAFAMVSRAAQRATRLVHDLLDFTHVLHGNVLPVRRQSFCLFELAQQLLDEFRVAHPAREIILEHTGSTDGFWDRDRIAQVISNLVGNASTYGNAAPLTVRVVGDDSHVHLQVHNWGAPIDAGVLPHLFEPWKRGSDKREPGSIGLGLFIVHEVVRAHGGSIAARSSPDEGTTFAVSIPRHA